jgi:hypothetical protein
METKRCQRCHKLLRIDAQVCSRCGGRDFMRVSAVTKSRPTINLAPAREAASLASHASLPSNPPASPHRVGHYSGLHPEDQPYQSSFLPVAQASPVAPAHVAPAAPVAPVRVASPTTPAPLPNEDEDEIVEEPVMTIEDVYATLPDEPTPVQPSRRRVAAYAPAPQPGTQRGLIVPSDFQAHEQDEAEVYRPLPSAPTAKEPLPLSLMPTQRPPRQRSRAIPVLLALSCFLFLVATSILAFLLMSNSSVAVFAPQIQVEPAGPLGPHDLLIISGSRFPADAQIRFTRDANIPILDASGAQLEVTAYNSGNFSVTISIPADWPAGQHIIYATDQQNHAASALITVVLPQAKPPHLQLASSRLDLGASDTGTISRKTFTLSNNGGDQATWQATSSASWLTISPTHGTFTISQAVEVTVNRTALVPQSYTGHIVFIMQGTHQSVTLTVTMAVNPAPVSPAAANLQITSAALNFSGNPVQNPSSQGLTLQNTGGQPLDWTASVTTSSGGNWLSLSALNGSLAAGSSEALSVSVSSLGLSTGTYNGSLIFSYGGTTLTPVTVSLAVSPPPTAGLAVQPGGLTFNAILGQNPASQSFLITNTGNATLNWGITEDSNGTNYAPATPSRGSLAPGKSYPITVTPSITQLAAGTMNALITIYDTDTSTPVKSQQVKVTFSIVNQAVLSLNENAMSFSHPSNIPISTQTLIITDTGSATLNWSLTVSNPSPIAWISVDNTGSSLTAGTTDFVNVTVDSSHLSPGTYTATLHVQDTDAGTPVAPQTVVVTLTVTS